MTIIATFKRYKPSPSGRNDVSASAAFQADRSKATTASQPEALQMRQSRFVKYPG